MPQEYFVYFKAFITKCCGKRSGGKMARGFEGVPNKKGSGAKYLRPALYSRFALSVSVVVTHV